MAEWSKALDLGSSLCGGVGLNPTTASRKFVRQCSVVYRQQHPLLTASVVSGYVQPLST